MHATVLPTNVDIPEPSHRPTTVLTPRGVVAAQIVRLEYDLAELAGEDRACFLDLLRDLVDVATA